MMGKLGFDINISHLKPAELSFCKEAVKNYDRLQSLICFGDQYRLISPYQNRYAAMMSVDTAKSKAVLFLYSLNTRFGDVFSRMQLNGLDAEKKYIVK